VEIHRLRVLAPEARDVVRARVPEGGGPAAPVAETFAAPALEVLRQRREGREVAQGLPLLLQEDRVGATALRVAAAMQATEARVHRFEDRSQDRHHPLVVDLTSPTQPSELGGRRSHRRGAGGELRNRRRVQIQRVAEESTHGCVRADVGTAIPLGVKGIQTHEGGTLLAGKADERAQIAQISGSPILAAAQRVQIGPKTEAAASVQQLARADAAARRANPRLLRLPSRTALAHDDVEMVIARSGRLGQRQRQPPLPAPHHRSALGRRLSPVLQAQLEPPLDRPATARGDLDAHVRGVGLVFEDHTHRREQAVAHAIPPRVQDRRRRRLAARIEPHRGEQRLPRGVGGHAPLAVEGAVGRDDASALRELSQPRTLRHR
jgi:hypothetical protein